VYGGNFHVRSSSAVGEAVGTVWSAAEKIPAGSGCARVGALVDAGVVLRGVGRRHGRVDVVRRVDGQIRNAVGAAGKAVADVPGSAPVSGDVDGATAASAPFAHVHDACAGDHDSRDGREPPASCRRAGHRRPGRPAVGRLVYSLAVQSVICRSLLTRARIESPSRSVGRVDRHGIDRQIRQAVGVGGPAGVWADAAPHSPISRADEEGAAIQCAIPGHGEDAAAVGEGAAADRRGPDRLPGPTGRRKGATRAMTGACGRQRPLLAQGRLEQVRLWSSIRG
jgi:hypothetical protein